MSAQKYRSDVLWAQLEEDTKEYDNAVESYNEHLDGHELDERETFSDHEQYEKVVDGAVSHIDDVIRELVAEGYRDSKLRRHPDTDPVHIEACKQMAAARQELIETMDDIMYVCRNRYS